MSVVTDSQQAGVEDDGTLSGVLRAKIVRGDLIALPFRPGHYFLENVGSVASFQTAVYSNADGTGTGIFVQVPAGGNGVRLWIPFYGRCFGVRFRRYDGGCNFTVTVDGVSVAVAGSHPELVAEASCPDSDNAYVITHDDLAEGTHIAQIVVDAPASGNNSTTLFGILAEKRLGYPTPVRVQCPSGPVTLTTSQTAIYATNTDVSFRYITQVTYCNTSGSAVTVTMTFDDVTMWTANLAAAGTAGDSAVYTFAGPTCPISVLKHAASAAGAVRATVLGGV